MSLKLTLYGCIAIFVVVTWLLAWSRTFEIAFSFAYKGTSMRVEARNMVIFYYLVWLAVSLILILLHLLHLQVCQ